MIHTENKYKAIVLILASNNLPIYNTFRNIWLQYLDLFSDIKVFFVYGNTSIASTTNDLIYTDIEEVYWPGMIQKTIKALEYIDKNYEYEYLLRTNLSTFWDFELLLNRLKSLPDRQCITGTFRRCTYKGIKSPEYVSGVNLILTRDLIQDIIYDKNLIISKDLPEDWSISQYFIDRGIFPKPSIPGAIHFMEKFTIKNRDEILKEIQLAKNMQHDHFRIKNRNRLEIDSFVMNVLLQEYYGKTVL